MAPKKLLHQWWWEREYNYNNNIYDDDELTTIEQKLIRLQQQQQQQQYKHEEEHQHQHHQQPQQNNHYHTINFINNATAAAIDEHFSAIILHRSSTSQSSASSPSLLSSSLSSSSSSSIFFPENSNLFLIISYFIVILIGILTNVTMLVTVCKTRLRNSLLIALCLADLLVTGLSAPITFMIDVCGTNKTSLLLMSQYYCKIIKYLQILPVAISTLTLLMLSFDRYATVKHPKLVQLRQRRGYLTILLPLMAFIIAMVVCSPQFLFYRIIQTQNHHHHHHHYSNNSQQYYNNSSICTSDFGSYHRRITFILIFTVTVFLIPGFGVLLNHLGVRKRLCALSLTARAAHGELPLPMPILRRPTHMIIVTGGIQPNTDRGRGLHNNKDNQEDDDDDDDDGNNFRCDANKNNKISNKTTADCADCKSNNIDGKMFGILKKKCKSKSHNKRSSEMPDGQQPKRGIIQKKKNKTIKKTTDYHRQSNTKSNTNTAAGTLPLPQTTTLRSRRRLANLLVIAALIFIICWSPYVFCFLSQEIADGEMQICSNIIFDYTLLLGYAHSAVSPILYWILNHSLIIRQTTCVPILRLTSMQKYLRTYLRPAAQSPPAPPSSTNEAALGPFNPRFIKTKPKHPGEYHVPAASSHYLY